MTALRRPLAVMLGSTFLLLIFFQCGAHWMKPVERAEIWGPVYTVCDASTGEALASGRRVARWGKLPLGIYRGCRAFPTARQALEHLQTTGKLRDGWAVYALSGEFGRDTYQLGQHHRTARTLRVTQRVAPSWTAHVPPPRR